MSRVACLIILLLTACSSPCYPGWTGRSIVTPCEQYNSAKLIFSTANTFREMDIEIAKSSSGVRVYGNIRSLPLPTERLIDCSIKVDGITSSINVEFFEGGQRVLFSPTTATEIISCLEEGKEVTLTVGRYKAYLTPENYLSASRVLEY